MSSKKKRYLAETVMTRLLSLVRNASRSPFPSVITQDLEAKNTQALVPQVSLSF